MLDENKNYWLYIAPHVYCRIEGTNALLYNTQNRQVIQTANAQNIELLVNLHDRTNLGAIYLEGIMLTDPILEEFLAEFVRKGMGELLDVDQQRLKPIQMMPVLNLQRDIDRFQRHETNTATKDSLRYLIELNLFLNDACQQGCALCHTCYRQGPCCTRSGGDKPQELDIDHLRRVLYQIKYSNVGKINLLGGDVFRYSHYRELLGHLSGLEDRVHIWNHYAHFPRTIDALPPLAYDVVVTFPCQDDLFHSCIQALSLGSQHKYHFYISSAAQYGQAVSLIETYHINNYSLHPVFTGDNLDFFEQNIYNDWQDILDGVKSFRQIFANQKLNSNYFGILTVRPAGDVFADINSPSLGNIRDMEICEIISKELTDNTAWRRTRTSAPCRHCLYQYLCPPPSGYEAALGKPNLCHVHP